MVLRNLRPLIPSGMPADFQLLMEHCWATDADNRPNVDRCGDRTEARPQRLHACAGQQHGTLHRLRRPR